MILVKIYWKSNQWAAFFILEELHAVDWTLVKQSIIESLTCRRQKEMYKAPFVAYKVKSMLLNVLGYMQCVK